MNKHDSHDATAQSIQERGFEVYGKTEKAASDVYDKTAKAATESYEKTREYSVENPGKTILVSLGVGADWGISWAQDLVLRAPVGSLIPWPTRYPILLGSSSGNQFSSGNQLRFIAGKF